MASKLDLPAQYRDQVIAILSGVAPGIEVWAYGSRVTGEAFEASDLDLVLRNPNHPELETGQRRVLREAFVDSDLPIHVDLVEWAMIPEAFRHEIERAYVILQTAEQPASN
jgi:predicted nucleotidyltransferase